MPRPLRQWMVFVLFATLGTLAACGDDAQTCRVDDDCASTELCEAGVCTDIEVTACDIDTPCPSGLTCATSGVCVRADLADRDGDGVIDFIDNCPDEANADQTDTDDDGVGDACEGGACEPCAPDEVCDDEGFCARVSCARDGDCDPAQVCVGSLCRYAPTCQTNADCSDVLGTCGDDGVCAPGCVTDVDCGDPAFVGCSDSECRFRCGGGADVCDFDEECRSGFCEPLECVGAGTEDCPDGQRCSSNVCVPFTLCSDDGDCAFSEQCVDAICESRVACVGDSSCPPSQLCDEGFCYLAESCEGRDDCGEDFDCVGDVCVPFVCRGPDDCLEDETCDGGECVDYDAPSGVAEVVILTRPGVILPDQSIALQAVALDEEGQLVVGAPLRWASSLTGVATIGAETGLALGGASSGTTDITAWVDGFAGTVSEPVPLTNPGPATEGQRRLTVVRADTGAPVVGATVQTGGGDTATTDSAGVVSLAVGSAEAVDLHVFASGHDAVSLYGITGTELVVPLPELSTNATISGFTGPFDFTDVTTDGDIDLGLAGASLAGDLINLDLATLLGDGFNTEVTSPLGDFAFPVPGGFVVIPNLAIVNGGKETYQVQGRGGLRLAWGLAGRVSLFDVIDQFGGGGGTGDIIAAVLPYFERFEHDLMPITLVETDRVEDSDDLDGDGDRAELIADYESFPELTLRPDVAQRLRTLVELPGPTTINGAPTDLVIIIGGTRVEEVGFVPLGLNAATVESGSEIPDVVLKMAPPHSGLSAGAYAVMVVTFDSNEAGVGLGGIDLPDSLSGRLAVFDTLPQTVTFSGSFPDLPEGSSVSDRTITVENVGADLYRVRVESPDGGWTIFSSAPGSLTLPQPPEGLPDPLAGPTIIVEALETESATLDDLASPTEPTIGTIDVAVTGFGRAVIDSSGGEE